MERLCEIAVGLCRGIGVCRFRPELATGEPSLSIPCYAERRYGGVLEDELLMALPPRYLPKIIDGLAHLSANGLRYPIRRASRTMPGPAWPSAMRPRARERPLCNG